VIERFPEAGSTSTRGYQNNRQQQIESTAISTYANQFWQSPDVPGANKAAENPAVLFQTGEATVAMAGHTSVAERQPYTLNASNSNKLHTVYENLEQLHQQKCVNNCRCCRTGSYASHYSLDGAALCHPPNMISNIASEPNPSNLVDKEFIDINQIADAGWCVTQNCPVYNVNLLGIKKSWNSHEWLVNISELSQKILSVYNDQNQKRIMSLFKTYYSLRSPIQITKWSQAIKEKNIREGQLYKNTFVDYSEAKLVIKNLGSLIKVYEKKNV